MPPPKFSFVEKKKEFPNSKARKGCVFSKIVQVQKKINRYLVEDFFPLAEKHMEEECVINVKGGEIDNECDDVIKKFSKELDLLNIKKNLEKIVEEVESDGTKLSKVTHENLNTYIEQYMEKVDDWIKSEFIRKSLEKEKNKCELKQSVYNFTNYKLSDEQLEILMLGKTAVVKCGETYEEAKARFKEELGEYIKSYVAAHEDCSIEFKKDQKIFEWIEEASRNSDIGVHQDFFRRIIDNIPATLSKINSNCVENSQSLPNKRHLEEIFDIEDCILSEVDKNYGMSLLNLDEIIKADSDIMKKMKANSVTISEEECMSEVQKSIKTFEENLSVEQRAFLDKINRNREQVAEACQFPKLKSTAKIHKMKPEEILNKDPTNLTFRPVCAAESWILRTYNIILMHILRKLNKDFEERILWKIMIKNGCAAAERVQKWKIKTGENEVFVAITADMSDAYTNVNLDLLIQAIKRIAEFLKLRKDYENVIIELAKLTLTNNYIKTTGGLFLLGPVLPMGNSASGDCLDTVALNCESQRILSNSGMLKTLEYHLIDYLRYKDDTCTPVCCQAKNLRKFLEDFAKVFPANIPVNIGMSGMSAKFLDVFFWRSFSKNTLVTTIARNFSMPPKYVTKKSMVPQSLKMCVSHSEIHRYLGICSSRELFDLNIKCLKRELICAGYEQSEIHEKITKIKLNIEKKNDVESNEANVNQIIPRRELNNSVQKEKVFFFTKTEYNEVSRTNLLLRDLIKNSRGNRSLSLPMEVPGKKLLQICYTKDKMQKKVKRYLENKNI